ncbi:FAD-dependent oxidoreductase [Klebsiella pneumoniae]|uniref:FAD-dependent oxidoreductase n=2 Tax=Klebsiella pneumoniae TaxID=573 RepID=A0A2X3BXX7_KLEPN|nr:FAD-dependent oxidoreductase [Klebsiella pneumoniae]
MLGGTSAWSGGWLWIPRNPLARAEGIDEAADAPLTYLQHEMGGEAADIRLQTFLRYGPEMVEFFHQRTAVQFLSAAPCRTFTRRRVRRTEGGRSPRNPTMAACSATGSIACVRRWKPLAWAGWASPAARIWRIFSMPPARRAPRCMPPAACCATAGSGYAPDGAASGQWQCAGRPSAAIRPRRRRAFSAQCPGGPAAAGAAGRVRRGAAQRRRGDSRRSWRRGAGLRRFSPRSPAAGAGGAPRGGGLRPFLRRTAGQSGRGDQAWRIRRRPVRHFPAPPAGLGAGVPRHSGQRPAANVSSSGGARQTRGDRRPAQRQTFC